MSLLRRRKVSTIVATITKMRGELQKAIEDAKVDIKAGAEKVVGFKKVRDEKVKKVEKRFGDKIKKEQNLMDESHKEITEANQWLESLPCVDNCDVNGLDDDGSIQCDETEEHF